MFSLKKKAVNNIQYFRSCSELFYYNFYRILETNNFRYLIIGWDEREEIQYNEENAKKIWSKIYDEYARLKKDNSMLKYLEICSELMYLESRITIVSSLIEMIASGTLTDDELELYFVELDRWKFKINRNKPIRQELIKLVRQLKQSKNKINLLLEERKQFESEGEESISLAKQIVKMEQALGRNEVNPRTTTVEKWIYLIEEINEMQTARQKGYGRE